MSFGSFTLAKPSEIPRRTQDSSARRPPAEHLAIKTESSSPDSLSSSPHIDIPEATVSGSSLKGRFTFVNTAKPRDAKASEIRKTVRSQAARLNPLEDTSDAGATAKKRRRSTRLYRTRTFRIEFRIKEACARARKSIEAPPTPPPSTNRMHKNTRLLTRSPTGGWANPFAWQKAASNGCAPFLFYHYLTELAVDIPELDFDGPAGLLRSRWFPMALTEPATSAVILLTSASHYAMLREGTRRAAQLLLMRTEALNHINEMLRDHTRALTDQAIAAVAKMASYEAMFGNKDTYLVHMNGLKRMIRLRGGLEHLGLDGLLMRMLLWIDTNAAWLIRTPLYFALHGREPGQPLPPVNPGMFLGAV